ncbi:type VI secretion system contractile sheath small subunit [Chryseobacterium fistulae]|nr:type VI secretion system contractile sheath small subunit [Chryseobacterium fistulae]
MAMFNYGVGGNEVKVDANEAIQEIQENKSLIVSQLTTEESYTPEIVTGLKTVEDVFKHFQPSVTVQHETEDGNSVQEEFRFQNLSDFTPKNLTRNSDYLQQLSMEQEQYNKIVRQLKTNKILRNILENGNTKVAFVEVLKEVAQELEK